MVSFEMNLHQVFDVHELTRLHQEELKKARVEEVRKEATEAAIQKVKDKIKAKFEAEAAAAEKGKQSFAMSIK